MIHVWVLENSDRNWELVATNRDNNAQIVCRLSVRLFAPFGHTVYLSYRWAHVSLVVDCRA